MRIKSSFYLPEDNAEWPVIKHLGNAYVAKEEAAYVHYIIPTITVKSTSFNNWRWMGIAQRWYPLIWLCYAPYVATFDTWKASLFFLLS